MIGKRKRETRRITRTDEASSSTTPRPPDLDIFKQYFETRFESLQGESTKEVGSSRNSDDLDTSSDAASLSDWDGLSSGEPIPPVEVIEHGKESTDVIDHIHQPKAFMSAKPPVFGDFVLTKNKRQDQSLTEDTAAEAVNLKNDLELQRLLKESHLLSRSSGSTLTHTHRHKALDLRMQSLGAKSSLFRQAKMPLSHHRGIIAKADQREASRRREAKENGIILEQEIKKRGAKKGRRERGVGAPTIGKFKDGTLKLNRRDISEIQGPQSSQRVSRKRRK